MEKTPKKPGRKLLRHLSRTQEKITENSKEHIKQNFFEPMRNLQNIRLLVVEWVLLVGALIMLAVTQAFWFSDSYAENSLGEGGTFSEGTVGSVSSLNPLFATTNSEKTLSRLMFSSLAETDYTGHTGLGLADSITHSDDGLVWKIHLRDHLKWSDGEPITVEDVIFTANLIKNPNVTSTYSSRLSSVTVALGESPGEVIFTLSRPFAYFNTALNFPIVPKHKLENVDPKNLAEDSFSKSPVTSGPFKFNAIQASPARGERVFYLSANPDYYRGEPLINTFAVYAFPNYQDLLKALNAGEIAATAEIPASDTDKVTSSQLLKKNVALNSGIYLFFNMDSDIFESRDMRRAVRESLDLTKVRALAPDTVALDYPLIPSQLELSEYPAIPTYNAAAAEQVAALMPENRSLQIAALDTNYFPEVTKEIARQLEALGFEVHVSLYNEQDQDFITQRAYDLLIFDIDLGTDPDLLPYYYANRAGKNGVNLSNYRSSIADDLLLALRTSFDPNFRAQKYRSFLNYWINDVPAIGLYRSNLTYFHNKNAEVFCNQLRPATDLDRFVDVTDWSVSKDKKNKTP